jgi:hypothetical protein
MKIISITAEKNEIHLKFEGAAGAGEITVIVRVPVVCRDSNAAFVPGRVLAEHKAVFQGVEVSIPRFIGDYDCLICRFEASQNGKPCDGVKYVTDIDPAVPEYNFPYPKKVIKALCVNDAEEARALALGQSSANPNIAELMTLNPEDAIEYRFNGQPYFFKKKAVERMDKRLKTLADCGVMCVLRYINSSNLSSAETEKGITALVQHPAFDYSSSSAYMSAFNLRTEAGLNYFCACTEFLAERYSRPDSPYGCCLSYEMGNEVTSQYIWGNAGELDVSEYMREYTSVMRIAWLLASKHYAHFRIHTSFDQYFKGRHIPDQPKRFYGMKECIDNIQRYCDEEGDFPWNVAFHPYPENLSFPDFYHDREPEFTFQTKRITFKNVEVMPAYLAQERLLYRGSPRRVILPEQGFNSRDGEPYTEWQAAHGYVLAYLKIRNQPTIDMFLHHNYIDGPWEFGLNLGVRRCAGLDAEGKEIAGEPKPIYYVMRDMDTPAEAGRIEAARSFIGPELFDWVLNPPPVVDHFDTNRGLGLMRMENVISKDGESKAAAANFDT